MNGRPYVETCVYVGGISADMHARVNEHVDGDRSVAWGDGWLGPGGRAAGAAVASVRLGRKFVELVGCVGDDILGESILSTIKQEGVSTRLVDRIESVATGMRQSVIDSKGERRMVGVANANGRCAENHARKAETTIFGADLLYATLEVPTTTVSRMIKTAAERDVPVLLDASPVPTPSGEDLLPPSIMHNVDVLLTNFPAAQRLSDMPPAHGPIAVEMAKRLLDSGPKAVVITMGEHGALVAVPGRHAMVEPRNVNAVDTASAGDAFAGGLAVALTAQARGSWRWEQMVEATRFACAAASVCVSRYGGQETLPTRKDVEAQLTRMFN